MWEWSSYFLFFRKGWGIKQQNFCNYWLRAITSHQNKCVCLWAELEDDKMPLLSFYVDTKLWYSFSPTSNKLQYKLMYNIKKKTTKYSMKPMTIILKVSANGLCRGWVMRYINKTHNNLRKPSYFNSELGCTLFWVSIKTRVWIVHLLGVYLFTLLLESFQHISTIQDKSHLLILVIQLH